jgi:hypothetical protein
MAKSLKKYKKSKTRSYRLKHKKSKRRISKRTRGGNGDKVVCSMCERMVNKDDTLIPRECLVKHGKGAHRICQDCWWNAKTGFAREDASHECPGCKKGIPLTDYVKEKPIFVDLTNDDL